MGTYHHGDLRAALVAQGLVVLERDGLAALTLRAVAREVGVSHAAPGRHFADAAAFHTAVAASGYRELAERLSATEDAGAEDALIAAGRAYVGFALDHPQLYRLVFHAGLTDTAWDDDEFRNASSAAFGVLEHHVQRAIDAGVLDRRPVRELALTLWSAVHGICSLVIDRQLTAKGFDADPRTLADTVLANAFLGLRAPTPTRRPRRASTDAAGLGSRIRQRAVDAEVAGLEPPLRRERPRTPKLPG
ncbi:MAG: TetR-like C-terminal domain-containing protein [Actinobacteria bacterium]|nr:TetR-like C-terminal domain-containing protein [Actinomycetota bacterium]